MTLSSLFPRSISKILFAACVTLCIAVLAIPLMTAAQTTVPANPDGTCRAGYTKTADPVTPGTPQTYTCQSDTAVPKAKDPVSCSAWTDTFNATCIWIAFASWLGSVLLSIGATALLIAGNIFDVLIAHIIIDFKGTLDTLGVTGAIDVGWTIFRDFANLFIIGLFVFIALSIILGVEEFGRKKLIANVLIVAVLLNFSLLFTKLIIDGSNFTAYQIYKQMGQSGTGTATQPDISAGFLKPMGITSVWNTYDLVKEFGATTNSGIQAFIFGLVGGLVLLAVAAVLAYGCYIIAARGILLIVLMLTASLAFATFLHPSLQKSEYGWDVWWKTLLNNALFAPLLMIFLFISLLILKQAEKAGGTVVNLGGTIADPRTLATGNGWQIILVYLLGIGLLFASLKLAGKMSGTIGGFNLAGSIIGKWPLAAAVIGGTAAWSAGRVNTTGRNAAASSAKLEKDMGRVNTLANTPGLDKALKANYEKQLASMQKNKTKLDKLASHDFNLLDSTLGKKLGKALGVEAGKAKGGFVGPRKEAAEDAAKATSGLITREGDAAKIAETIVRETQQGERGRLEETRKANEELLRAATVMADTAKESHQAEYDRNIEARAASAQQKVIIEQDKTIPTDQKAEQLRQEDNNIKLANQKIQESRQAMKYIDSAHLETAAIKKAKKELADTHAAIRDLDKKAKEEVSKTKDQIIGNSIETATNVGSRLVNADTYTKEQLQQKLRSKQGAKRVIERIKAEKEIAKDAGEPTGGTVI